MSNKILFWAAIISVISLYRTDGAVSPDASRSVGSRIIGGNDTTIEKWPFIVSFLYEMEHFCGGSLLTATKALSAAHCFDHGFPTNNGLTDLPDGLFHLRAGSSMHSEGGILASVTKAIMHEDFNRIIYRDYDIAVVLIGEALPLGGAIQVAKLPEHGKVVPDNSKVISIGWGLTSNDDNANISTTLQEVDEYKVNLTLCREGYAEIEKHIFETEGREVEYNVTDNMLCSGIWGVGGRASCTADSGGPVVYNGTLVGVISWALGCGLPNGMSVSVRVAKFDTWIEDNIKKLDNATVEIEENQVQGASTAKINFILAGIALFSLIIYY